MKDNIPFEQRRVLADEAAAKGRSIPALLKDRYGNKVSQRMVHDMEWAVVAPPSPRDSKTN